MSTITVNADVEIASGSKVGIGTANPDYPLHVASSVTSNNMNMRYWSYNVNGATASSWGSVSPATSIWAHYNVSAPTFFSPSDKRIKNDIVELDDNESFNLINHLGVKKYKYKDIVTRSNVDTYGFIAQQVEDVIPLATSTESDYLPSIYELSDISSVNGNVLITTANNLDLGNTEIYGNLTTPLSFRFYDSDNKQLEFNVIHVNDTTLQLDGNFSVSNGNLFLDGNVVGNVTEENKLFVYGPKVDDFKTLNKDKIFTVGISAIQELSRKNTTLENKATTLENKATTLENKVTTLETQIADVLSRLTALE